MALQDGQLCMGKASGKAGVLKINRALKQEQHTSTKHTRVVMLKQKNRPNKVGLLEADLR